MKKALEQRKDKCDAAVAETKRELERGLARVDQDVAAGILTPAAAGKAKEALKRKSTAKVSTPPRTT